MSDEREQRGLLLMRAGAHAFAVYAEEADGVVGWREPVPLPHAPPAVLGVVSVRGRMRTVLDPAVLLGAGAAHEGAENEAPHRFVVVLRGDEQLALAVAHAEPVAAPADLVPPDPPAPFLRATLRHQDQTVHLLDPAHLFAAATQGTERRRKRSNE
jgi:chemotaxis signal transduction protein